MWTGTLIPTRDPTSPPRVELPLLDNLRVALDANTRLVIALGEPQPGNRNDTIVYRSSGINEHLAGGAVMAAGGYRGNPQVFMPYRKPVDGSELPDWKQDYNTRHRKVRARVEHCLARLKTYKILRNHRRAGRTLAVTAAGIAHLHNIALPLKGDAASSSETSLSPNS